MKKNTIALLMAGAILASSTMPVLAQEPNMQKPQTWTQKQKAKFKRHWFCLRNKDKCTKEEVKKARRWLIWAPAIAVAAIAAAIGVSILAVKAQQKEEQLTFTQSLTKEYLLHIVSAVIALSTTVNEEPAKRLSMIQENFRTNFGNVTIGEDALRQAHPTAYQKYLELKKSPRTFKPFTADEAEQIIYAIEHPIGGAD